MVDNSFMTNKKYYDLTHKATTKQTLKDGVDLAELQTFLPEHQTNFFFNKTILGDQNKIFQLFAAQDGRIRNLNNLEMSIAI